jgi:hypothetical protein
MVNVPLGLAVTSVPVFSSAPTTTFFPLRLACADAAFSAARMRGFTRTALVAGGRACGGGPADRTVAACAGLAVISPALTAEAAAIANSLVRASPGDRDICMAESGPFLTEEVAIRAARFSHRHSRPP